MLLVNFAHRLARRHSVAVNYTRVIGRPGGRGAKPDTKSYINPGSPVRRPSVRKQPAVPCRP